MYLFRHPAQTDMYYTLVLQQLADVWLPALIRPSPKASIVFSDDAAMTPIQKTDLCRSNPGSTLATETGDQAHEQCNQLHARLERNTYTRSACEPQPEGLTLNGLAKEKQ